MAEWLAVFPQILFVASVWAVPGLIVAWCLRFRGWDAFGVCVPLSLGVVALANLISTAINVRWGLPVIGGTAAGLVALLLGVSSLAGYWGAPVIRRSETVTAAGIVWSRRQHLVAVAATLGAAVLGAFAISRGIGTPDTLNQTFDGAFHVNSIGYIAEHHAAAPSVFERMSDPGATGGFYPPSFSATAALAVIYTGLNPVVAANAAAVAIAVLWPLSMSLVLRRLARPNAFGYSVAMVGAVTVGLFPALLLEWGVVWPNALSILAVGPVLVVVISLLSRNHGLDSDEGPYRPLPRRSALAALALSTPGLVMAHPSALYAVFYLAVPAVAVWLWKVAQARLEGRRPGAAILAGTILGTVALVFSVIWLSYRVSAIRSVANFMWPPSEPWWDGLIQVLALTSRRSHANLAFAFLVLVGMYVALRHRRGRILVVGFWIVAVLYVCAIAIQSPATMFFTGFWYNDPYRIVGLVPTLALPLAALGADAARAALIGVISARREETRHKLSTGFVAAGVICFSILLLQGGLGTARISHTVVASYRWEGGLLVSPGQEAMFRRLSQQLAPGETIAGNPFTGEALAGVVSGRPVIYPGFSQPSDPVRAMVASNFGEFRTDPVVCAAVKSLNIKIVVTGQIFSNQISKNSESYRGFDQMAQIPGLTRIDSGGGATAFRVGDCNSGPYQDGLLLTAGQEQMFKRIRAHLSSGDAIVGSPLAGEIFAGTARNPVIFPDFSAPTSPDAALVAAGFRQYLSNPTVCAAVQRLRIKLAVTGPTYGGVTAADEARFGAFHNTGFIPGLVSDDLAHIPGLQRLDSGGGAVAYRVGDCIGFS